MMWLLWPAAFFNGFDASLRALLLPQLQDAFHVGVATLGVASVPITAGQFVAFFAVQAADRVGRRPLLLVSLLGYTLFTGLTALSWSVVSFATFQFFAQVFLGTEFAMAVIVVSEELPPASRGRALGRLLISGPLGAVIAAVLLAAGLGHTTLHWRAFYLVGLVPLLLIAYARRLLQETRAYQVSAAARAEAGSAGGMLPGGLRRLVVAWRKPWRSNVIALGLVSFLQKVPTSAGAGWWVYYAEKQRHWSSTLVSIFLVCAYGLGTTGYYFCGRAMDRFGRRPTAAVYLTLGIVLGALAFQVDYKPAAFVLIIGAVFFGLGIGPALSAFGAELFPTRIRAEANAWVGNGFANAGSVLGPALVGILGDKNGLVGNVGDTVSLLCVVGLPAIPIIWFKLRETRGVSLLEP